MAGSAVDAVDHHPQKRRPRVEAKPYAHVDEAGVTVATRAGKPAIRARRDHDAPPRLELGP